MNVGISFQLEGIFLDRDGVINIERADYVKSWEEFQFLSGTQDAIQQLALLNVPIYIITNQSCIGRGIRSREQIDLIHEKMMAQFEGWGLSITKIFMCPHHPDDGCRCRKPEPGMLLDAAEKYRLDLKKCVFIGDSITDFQAAERAGCQSFLVRSGRQGATFDSTFQQNTAVPIFDNLAEAVLYLCENQDSAG
ncbi:MAG: D-glycero-beta-D-manno-heptose 1,7-bisphosphate 7-phosphatase [Chloroflexota bacterium]